MIVMILYSVVGPTERRAYRGLVFFEDLHDEPRDSGSRFVWPH